MTDTCEIDASGTKRYFRDGKTHRDGDLPAVEYANGSGLYYRDGVLHRDGDLPAVEYANGYKEYWRNGEQYFPEVAK